MANGWGPGERLPSETEMIARFGMAKGTIREAIRILEAQGLVKSRTGPGGGVFVHQVSEERATALLGNYFYFQHLTIDDVYQNEERKLVLQKTLEKHWNDLMGDFRKLSKEGE